MSADPEHGGGFAGTLARLFIAAQLTPLLVLVSVVLGLAAVLSLPREEEPQIQVPMIDVLVEMPGRPASEVENRVTRPLEQLLWEIPSVEYLYSTSSPEQSLVIVRFEVGTPLDAAVVRVNEMIQAHMDRIPLGVRPPLVQPRTIDDVPVLALTLHSKSYDHFTLRRLAAQLLDELKPLPQVAETQIIGGYPRELRVQLDPAALWSHGVSVPQVAEAIQAANRPTLAGSRPFAGREVLLETGDFLNDAAALGAVVVGTLGRAPVYTRDVATVTDGPAETDQYVLSGAGGTQGWEAAVTLTFAKEPGANAIEVVEAILQRVESLQGYLIPAEVAVTVTRDYGHTAAEKSNELLLHMGIAVFGVSLLILFFLGWRESLVVLLAIPSTLALTLAVFYFYGYTLNRITLFALIFSIGILVDDAIVVVENIVRHYRLPGSGGRPLREVAVEAVAEVGNPTVLATWAVIAAILPMAFVGGLMGPYMRPIPVGATAAMLFSLLVAFTITPWAALRILRRHCGGGHGEAPRPDAFTRFYHWVMERLLGRALWRSAFLAGIVVLLLAALALVPLGGVKVKMLPFDNKSEFQVILNLPEGRPLEATSAAAVEMGDALRSLPEVRDVQIYAGTAAPFNFNGLVRHYFQRQGPTVADLQVNLVPKHARHEQSHAIAKRARELLQPIARRHGAALTVAEVPPGPPVLQTLVAEVYGPSEADRLRLAEEVKAILESTPGVVDVDWYVEELQPQVRFRVDREKADLNGIREDAIARTVALATRGEALGLFHAPEEREDVPIRLELDRERLRRPDDLLAFAVRDERLPDAPLVPLRELVSPEPGWGERHLYRKNLQPVLYVTGDVAGAVESPVYALLGMTARLQALDARDFGGRDEELNLFHLGLPHGDSQPAVKWDGEWHITLEVFRDLGIAFAAVLVLIYLLMVGWFRDYRVPFVVMAAIPFSLIGILPAHGALGAFFSATSMIGFMAGAGIVVRNSIILVDFIELRRREGLPLAEAVVEAGAVRFRPMLLTALAVILGASVILADPIFQGLAISLMFGEVASLLISRMAVPVLYFLLHRSAVTA